MHTHVLTQCIHNALCPSVLSVSFYLSISSISSSLQIPYRDSKLTKLTADVLAGKSNAALIATVGPALPNNSETLSTLLFASRCMDVELQNVETNEVVDYPGKLGYNLR
jgi:hypothetical protein